MKALSRTVSWFVAPSRTGVCLTAGGTEYALSIAEADALAEALDEAALYSRSRKATDD